MPKSDVDLVTFYDLLKRTVIDMGRRRGRVDYLEIGVCEGRSLKTVLSCPAVRLAVGLDCWDAAIGGYGRGSANSVSQSLGDNMDRVVLITGDSHVLLRGLRHTFDVILVDGDHNGDGALQDLEDCLPLLARLGVLLFDDCRHPQHSYLENVATQFANQHNLSITIQPVGHAVALITRQ